MSTFPNSFSRLLRKFIANMFILAPMLVCAQTQSTDNSCPPPAMPLEQQKAYIANTPALNSGFLWRIEKDGRTSWLYGTIHINHIDYAKPGSQIMRGLRNSDVLAVEINPFEIKNANVSLTVPDFELTHVQLERLKNAYSTECLAFNPDKVPPSRVFIPLKNSQAQRDGLFFVYSPDLILTGIAKKIGKPIIELENLQQRLSVSKLTSQSEFDMMFDTTMRQIETGGIRAGIMGLSMAWRKNDWQIMAKFEQDFTDSQPEFNNQLRDQRNELMAQKIDALHIEGKKVFVAVGALHMAGKNGLINLLQNKGYVVTFVPMRN
jgi:uncharacterized protein YbaP (TraB family)